MTFEAQQNTTPDFPNQINEHYDARQSRHLAFRDAEGCLFMCVDDGWVDKDGDVMSKTYPIFPATPLSATGEFLKIV